MTLQSTFTSHVFVCVYIYIYINIYIHIYTHIHTNIHTLARSRDHTYIRIFTVLYTPFFSHGKLCNGLSNTNNSTYTYNHT